MHDRERPGFLPIKAATAMAVVSKVVAPSKPQHHAADLYVEAMELVPKDEIASSVQMMRQLQLLSNTQSVDPAASTEAAWQQKKCRRLQRYPTMDGNS